MKRFFTPFAAVTSLIFLISTTGCYNSPEFINPIYNCECGSIQFDGGVHALKMAEAVVPDSTNQLSRNYHIVADLRTPEEVDAHVDAHDLTFTMLFGNLDDVVYYIPQDSVYHFIQEINHGDDIFPVRDYVCTDGFIEINPALAGGTETVKFDVSVREEVNGSLVGFPLSFSGEFTATID
jgi:hypothetical protein